MRKLIWTAAIFLIVSTVASLAVTINIDADKPLPAAVFAALMKAVEFPDPIKPEEVTHIADGEGIMSVRVGSTGHPRFIVARIQNPKYCEGEICLTVACLKSDPDATRLHGCVGLPCRKSFLYFDVIDPVMNGSQVLGCRSVEGRDLGIAISENLILVTP